MTVLLEVRDLAVSFPAPQGGLRPVDGVSFEVAAGESLALVGESGCGKSLTALAIPGLLPRPGVIVEGSRIRLQGQELTGLPERALRRVRGRRIGMLFQDPMTSLNPLLSLGRQLAEVLQLHRGLDRAAARAEGAALLTEVGLPAATERLDQYPHELSGGMRQRAMIALALAGNPDLLIADEATTALDVTVQAQVLELLDRLRRQRGLGLLLITHDLGVVAGHADRVAVMYAGRLVETAATGELFTTPAHPYTRGLLAAVPRLDQAVSRLAAIPGTVPRPGAWPTGCRFHPRCAQVLARCPTDDPPPFQLGRGHATRCWLEAP